MKFIPLYALQYVAVTNSLYITTILVNTVSPELMVAYGVLVVVHASLAFVVDLQGKVNRSDLTMKQKNGITWTPITSCVQLYSGVLDKFLCFP